MRTLSIGLSVLLSLVPACYYSGSWEPEDPEPGMISGRVVDAQTGMPVEGALISTEPATSTTTSNSQGTFSIETPPLTNPTLVSVRADSPGKRQRETSCVTVAPNDNTSADVQLISNNAEPCASSCTDGNICLGGICVSQCNPVCACNERCEEGRCVIDQSQPQPGDQCPAGTVLGSDGFTCRSTGGGGTGGGGQTGCGSGYVESATGCVQVPLNGNWRFELHMEVDMDANVATMSDRESVSVVWEFTVSDSTYSSSYGRWLAHYGGGRMTSLTGESIRSPSSAAPQAGDRCSPGEELWGMMEMRDDGTLRILSDGTGLEVCGRVDGGPTQVLFIPATTYSPDPPLTTNGFSRSFPVSGISVAAYVGKVVSASGSVVIR